jgi:DNA-binding CsgD family transcriptional regulator
LYRFTSAEARLVEALLQGERIADYADRVGISINTANTQLKHVFTKTETNRQADLMRQMFSDPIASMVAGGRVAVQWDIDQASATGGRPRRRAGTLRRHSSHYQTRSLARLRADPAAVIVAPQPRACSNDGEGPSSRVEGLGLK